MADMSSKQKTKTKHTKKNIFLKYWDQIKKYVQKSVNKGKKKIPLIRKTAVFYFSLVRLRSKNFIRYRVSLYLESKKNFIGGSIYFVLLLSFVYFLGPYIAIFDRSDALTFFTAVAAMIGGILAIIFSLSILLMGNAAERIPVGFYETAAKDNVHDLIFFLITACALVVFSFSLLFGNLGLGLSTASLQLSLILVGFVFYLTFILYQRVRTRLNPNNVLKIASEQALHKIESIYKRAQEIANVLMKQPKLDKKVTKQEALATSFQYMQPEFAYINSRLNYLFDYHDRLVSTNERSSALQVLQVITSILQKYFEVRKDSSFVLPAGFVLATTSDSRAFLTPPLERLVAVGENYMRENDNQGITQVINIFVQLSQSASQINYLTKRKVESPIMEQCRGYLDQLLQSAIKFKYQEALFQGAVAYGQIAPIAIKQNLHYEFISIYGMLDKIAFSALGNKYNVVLGEVINTYNSILTQLITSKYFNLEMELGSLWEHLRQIIYYAYLSMMAGALDSSFVMQTNLSNPFENTSSLIFQIAKAANSAKKEDDRKEWKGIFFVVVEELRSTLRYISEKMKNPNHLLVNTFGNLIADIGCLLLDLTEDEKWQQDKEELLKQVGWYIFQTEWFTHDVEKIRKDQSLDSLVEAAAKIGIRALQKNQDQVAKDAIKIISNFANKMLTKEAGDSFGFTEPRIMKRACFIGILALKQDKMEIVNYLKEFINPFEKAYAKKWFSDVPEGVKLSSPTEKQLMMEVHGLVEAIRDRYNRVPMLGRSSEIIVRIVNEEDVNKFIWEVWKAKIETKVRRMF